MGKETKEALRLRVVATASCAVLAGSLVFPSTLLSQGGKPASAASRAPSTRKSTADVDSISALLGRRIDAPIVSKPFRGGVRSMDEMGRTVCRFLHHRAADSLYALCIDEEELRDIMWPEYLQSRGTGLTAEDAWQISYMRLISGTRDATSEFGGRHYEFLRWERTAATKPYKNFKLHNGMVLVARRDDGEVLKMHWLRAVAERKGRFKIQSVRD